MIVIDNNLRFLNSGELKIIVISIKEKEEAD